jgi:hypothetical protein
MRYRIGIGETIPNEVSEKSHPTSSMPSFKTVEGPLSKLGAGRLPTVPAKYDS